MGAPKQYTDAQIAEYMAHVRESAGAKYTPEQIKEYEQHVRDVAGPDASGFKPDKPAEADIFGDDVNRLQAGFGDPKGIEDAKLLAGGYGGVRRNSSGELVAQGPDGKWYKDQSSLFKNPLNWMESAVGGAPATAGMMVGGALGGGLASIPAAAAGSAAGEAARGGIGSLMGVYSGKDRASDIASEGLGGAVAEVGGKVIGKVAKPILDPVKARTAALWSKIAGALSGVDSSDVLRTMEKRGAVFNPRGTQEIGKEMADELGSRQASESAAHRAATEDFNANEAGKVVSTAPVLSASQMELERAAPSLTGEGTMTQHEYEGLSARQRKNLLTPPVEVTPVKQTITYGKPSAQTTYPRIPKTITQIDPITGPGWKSMLTGDQTPGMNRGRLMQIQNEIDRSNLSILNDSGVNPYGDKIPIEVSAVERGIERAGPTILAEPQRAESTLGDLLQYKKGLSADVGRHYDKAGLIGDRTPRNVSFMESEAGRVADLIHEHSPGMAAADARLSDYANKSKLLKPVMNEGTQQGFIDTLINSSKKDNARDAAASLVPTSYESALDLGANRAWTKPGESIIKTPLGSIPGRAVAEMGLLAGAEYGREHHSPWGLLPAAAAMAISPRAHREFIRSGIPLMKQIPAAAAKPVVKRFSPFNTDEEK